MRRTTASRSDWRAPNAAHCGRFLGPQAVTGARFRTFVNYSLNRQLNAGARPADTTGYRRISWPNRGSPVCLLSAAKKLFVEALLCAIAYIQRDGFILAWRKVEADLQEIAMIRKIVLAAMVAASLGSMATAATAAIIVQVAPPPPRVEAVPPPRRGHFWVPGHWEWRGNHHHWVSGAWVRERPGYHYMQPTWVERDGRWHMEQGGWRRGDRDGDGVPDRQDRRPDDPRRY
jgi:hypothetical protein